MSVCAPHIVLKDLAEAMFMGVNMGRLLKGPLGNDTVALIHVKDIVDGVLPAVELLDRVNRLNIQQNARQSLLPGDILVSARGTLLKCAVITASYVGSVASSNFIIIRLGKHTVLQPKLLVAFLRQPSTQAQILRTVTSTVQPALTIRDLDELHVPIPPLDTQPDLVRLLDIATEQYRCAVNSARLRLEEAMDIVAEHMDVNNEQ